MKHTLVVITLLLTATMGQAQNLTAKTQEILAHNLKAAATTSHLELSWETGPKDASNYWEVQGSADGRDFSTIGLVLGGKEGEGMMMFSFKQKTKDIRPTYKYYRVLHIASETSAIASSVVRLSK